MRSHALLLGAAVFAAGATTASAQGYDWGGGTCIGYGCLEGRYARPAPGGYRTVRTYEEYEVRPRLRAYGHRSYPVRDDDWDDDDDLD